MLKSSEAPPRRKQKPTGLLTDRKIQSIFLSRARQPLRPENAIVCARCDETQQSDRMRDEPVCVLVCMCPRLRRGIRNRSRRLLRETITQANRHNISKRNKHIWKNPGNIQTCQQILFLSFFTKTYNRCKMNKLLQFSIFNFNSF